MNTEQQKKKRIDTAAKGRRIARMAADLLRARDYLVEMASPILRWWKAPDGRLVPLTVKHDFFGVWDLMAQSPRGRIRCFQVTTPDHLAHRRAHILDSPWRSSPADAILVWHGGRGNQYFAVWPGPDFSEATQVWRVPRRRRRARGRSLRQPAAEVGERERVVLPGAIPPPSHAPSG